MRGVDTPIASFESGTGTVQATTSYSDYDPSGNSKGGTSDIVDTNRTNVGDPKFVDAAGGDYRLRFDSPLIDIGEPVDPTTTTDLAGGARLVDGDLSGGARRDIGAFEYQAQAPTAASSGPATALTAEQVTFSDAGSADPDPGDVLSFAWTVDGVAAGTGPTLITTFQSAGAHSVVLTVTDPIGRQATASRTIEVTAAPAAGGEPPPAPAVVDTVAPVLSQLSAAPSRARPGKRISFHFQLTEPATIRIEIQRALPGRRDRGSCRKPSSRNRKGRKCTRFKRTAVLGANGTAGQNSVSFSGRVSGRGLPPGRYRALISATDAAGNRSRTRAISFSVTRH
jgi:hypothetical protein